jgi:RNA polymerase sigma-70 factor (ECF subfamily)
LDELRERSGVRLEEAATAADPIESSAYNTLISLMHQLVNSKVTVRQRDVLLAELSAMPQDEIARQLKITRNAVYKLSHDARKGLRRALETAGYTVEQVRDALARQTR